MSNNLTPSPIFGNINISHIFTYCFKQQTSHKYITKTKTYKYFKFQKQTSATKTFTVKEKYKMYRLDATAYKRNAT